MRNRIRPLLLLLGLALVLAAPVQPVSVRAAEPDGYMPGFVSLGTTLEGGGRLDIAVWYPVPATRRGVGLLQIEGWTFRGGRDVKPGEGPFPLLIISHAAAGSRFSHHVMAAALAEQGFVVAAPTHPGDNMDSAALMFLPAQVLDRPLHIRATIDTVLNAEIFANTHIHPSAIGIIGAGSGAAAALLLAGGVPDGMELGSHCAQAAIGDPYCSQWAIERLRGIESVFSFIHPAPDSRIKAVALLAPAWGMAFSQRSLQHIAVPVFIAAGQADELTPPALHARRIRDNLPVEPLYTLYEDADHAAFFAPCPPLLARDLPALCTRMDRTSHRELTTRLVSGLAAFFHTALKE